MRVEELPLWAPWYPKFMYHKDQGTHLCHDPSERLGLGAGWCDSPADVNDPPPLKQLSYDNILDPDSVETTEAVAKAKEANAAPVVKGDPADEYYQLNVGQVLMLIEGAKTDLKAHVLLEIKAKEIGHPKKGLEGGRSGVLKALEDAISTLERLRV